MLSNKLLKQKAGYTWFFRHNLRFFFRNGSESQSFISMKLTPKHESFPFQRRVSLLNTKNGEQKFLTNIELTPFLRKNMSLYMIAGSLIIK